MATDSERAFALINKGADPGASESDDEEKREHERETEEKEPAHGAQDEVSGTDDGSAEGEQPDDEDDAEPEAPTLTPEKLAELAGLEVGELYENLDVPLGDERGTVKLGALKDGYLEVARLEDREGKLRDERDAFEENMRTRETAQIRHQREMDMLLGAVDKAKLEPAVLQEIGERFEEQLRTESARLLQARPAWKEQAVRSERSSRIHDLLREYGWSRAEASNIYDHRILVMLDDMATLIDRAADARKQVEAGRKKREPRRKTAARATANGDGRRAKTSGQREKDASAAAHALVQRALSGQR